MSDHLYLNLIFGEQAMVDGGSLIFDSQCPVLLQSKPIKVEKRTSSGLKVLINRQCRFVSAINQKCNKPKSAQTDR